VSTLSPIRFDELKAANQLPSPTGVALAILRLAESETTTAQEIAHVLQADPALSGRLLKIANSAYSGRPRAVGSIGDAVKHLGVRMVRDVALSFSLISQHTRGGCQRFDYGTFWSHSLAMAVAAQATAQHTGKIVPAEAFTWGLLARVGRLALASIYPDVYSEILSQAPAGSCADLCRLEQTRFATDHNALSAALLDDWGLPQICVDAVRHHEEPGQCELPEGNRTRVLAHVLNVAGRIANVCIAGEDNRAAGMMDLIAAAAGIGIPSQALADLCDRVVAEWHDWGRILQVDTREVPPFAELAERAEACRAELANLSDSEEAGVDETEGKSLSIVLIDDDAVQLRLSSRYLTKAGHQVRTAANGMEGLSLVLETNPQLVITDLYMPQMNGTAVVRSLRQTKLGRALYILMLTSSDDDENQVAAFEAGADDYVVKPFRPRLLDARLRACSRVVRLQSEVAREKEALHSCMAKLGVANRKLQQAALTDPLTGLNNRRYALDRLDQEWSDATRSGQPLACMMLDIDFFKRVNDTHGHDVGDVVLRETAGVVRNCLRQGDVVCRLGGEEFLVIGPGMDREAAYTCAERIRAAVAAQRIEGGKTPLQVTMSIGVSVRGAETASPSALLKAADEAVYAAKKGGRNQVRLAPSHADEPEASATV
jgi:two-component system cell cycle response regulator